METVTAKQIHAAFDSAADALLVEVEDNRAVLEKKTKRLTALGFNRCSEVVQFKNFDGKLESRRTAHELAKKYRAKYPGIKFISEEQLDSICLKYSLAVKPVSEYTGDVPEQKLFGIERLLDEIHVADIPNDRFEYCLHIRNGLHLEVQKCVDSYEDAKRCTERLAFPRHPFSSGYYTGSCSYTHEGRMPLSSSELVKAFREKGVPEEDISVKDIRLADRSLNSVLKIAAPASTFREMPAKGTDPVVLQPVNGGYMVLAKWDGEADDR
jgi:hypothetical protein